MADKVAFMSHGRVEKFGTPQAIKQSFGEKWVACITVVENNLTLLE